MTSKRRMTRAEHRQATLDAAEEYIEEGWSLIVLQGINKDGTCTCGRRNCPSPGKHPVAEFFPNGVKSATTDLRLIAKALRRNARYNLAGSLVGRTVLDTDGPAGEEIVKKKSASLRG